MINLYIFLAVLVGILILISIKFYVITSPNKNNYTIQQKINLNHYGKYGSLGKYNDYNI